MKRLIFLLAAVVSVTRAVAQPVLVGHRGSLYGVENTVESFTNGARRGYAYLETDVKVTKDGKHVCSHNDDTSALGGTLAIASSTLEQLQSETLTQTRGGVKYTGRLCSLGEYLDVCANENVRPLIELKWATGINSNDCSGIPALIDEIESKGFRDKCIILTSMKPCLEYIRTNYPDITLQFLTGQYWSSHFDWCVQWKIDVNIQAGYFDKSTVSKFHDNGLKVNMWTTNTNDGYRTYGNMGCDFITTDSLDPENLPELDQSVTFPPNTVDYPNLDAPVKGSYAVEQVCDVEFPDRLSVMTVRRALMRDGKWIVLAIDSDDAPHLFKVDPESGEITAEYKTDGVSGGTIVLNDIAMTADGMLLGCNLATVPFAGGGDVWKVYGWTDAGADPVTLLSIGTADHLGNWTNAVAGNTFAVSGRSGDLKIYVATRSSAGTTYRIGGIYMNGGETTYTYALDNLNYTSDRWGEFHLAVTPSSRNNVLVDSPVMIPEEYTFLWDGERIPMERYAIMDGNIATAAATGVSFLRYGGKVYALVPSCSADRSAATARLYDMMPTIAGMDAVTPQLHPGLGETPAAYMTTAVEHRDGVTYMYIFAQGQGMAKFMLQVPSGPETPQDVDLVLEREWINSNTTGNIPQHIDGTNAQQGTAVNGVFYVNDCADRLIYVFDRSGCVGSIPGGAGWGCARDDAGNILVRDDKLSGSTHSFILYPAGAMPGDYGEAITFDVEVPNEGQTNFINASGDLVGGTGHIYMFPNGRNAANIITMEAGKVKSARSSGDLSVNGSTAGYIIPVDDDTENWIYQIRTSGLWFYNGGVNNDLSTSRPSTTAPARNSTGGGAYFTVKGNRILVHNSGANYKGGFTVRNLSADAVVTSVGPIGAMGYEAGGNYSTFNWLIAEKAGDNAYTIYQYCPSNGMAVYRLYDKDSGVGSVSADDTGGDVLSVRIDGDILSVVSPYVVDSVEIYSATGLPVMSAVGACADISALPAGVYIVKADGNRSAKFIRK